MQITRQADYAARAVLHLASMDPNSRAATSAIAAEQGIPPSFLAKIISQLSVAGIVHTSRGARGGVSLSRPPEEITLREVIEAIDGPILLNECVANDHVCPYSDRCPIHDIWSDTQQELIKRLNDATFDKLADTYHEKGY
ncbi:MAG: Rrf2 family transcriptional regulator [Anaerolineales bacterium]|nr:Rrf2 family transcriptional regulator [Anaerolineales bacterium]